VLISKIKQRWSEWSYQKMKHKLMLELTASDQSNQILAISFAFGLFVTLSPFWGLQNVIAIVVAIRFKLNKVIVVVLANLSSFPPLVPIIVFTAYQTGSLVTQGHLSESIPQLDELANLKAHFITYCVGAMVSGAALSLLLYLIVLPILNKKRPQHA